MANKFVQALVELGAEAKHWQELATDSRKAFESEQKRRLEAQETVNKRGEEISDLRRRIDEIKRNHSEDLAAQRVETGRRVAQFDKENSELKRRVEELVRESERMQTKYEKDLESYGDDYKILYSRYDFARKFISLCGLGRIWGAAIKIKKFNKPRLASVKQAVKNV